MPLVRFLETTTTYDGRQLRSHWIYRTTGLMGDAAVAFIGPCDVPIERMVDVEDVRARSPIYSREMLHFLAEFFHRDLDRIVLTQHLLMSLIHDELAAAGISNVRRRGNDLYDGSAKLSVSIATLSPVSALIHAGINVVSEGTPVPTRGLSDYGILPAPLALRVLDRFHEEMEAVHRARCKVRGVE